jgi:hypothetical protein
MTLTEALVAALKAHGHFADPVFVGTISEVTEATFSCLVTTPEAPEAPVPCRYVPIADADDVATQFVPAVGSAAIGIYLEPDQQAGFLIAAARHTRIALPCTDVTFGTGANGGVPKAQTVAARLARLENDINSLKTALTAHAHPSHGTPSPGLSSLTAITPITAQADLENPQLKH